MAESSAPRGLRMTRALSMRVRALLRAAVPPLEDDRYMAPDIATAAALVTSGALGKATNLALPAVALDAAERGAGAGCARPHR